MSIYLKNLFENHGIKGQIQDQWLVFQNDLKIKSEIVNETKYAHGYTVQLDITVRIEDGRQIIESFAGIGNNRAEAVLSALDNFSLNSFQVIIATFFNREESRVTKVIWSIDERKRLVIMSHMGFRGEVPTENRVHIRWFERFEEIIKQEKLETGLNWISLFFAQTKNELMTLEVLLNNAPWINVQKKMVDINWPKSDNFFSIRMFLIILDSE